MLKHPLLSGTVEIAQGSAYRDGRTVHVLGVEPVGSFFIIRQYLAEGGYTRYR